MKVIAAVVGVLLSIPVLALGGLAPASDLGLPPEADLAPMVLSHPNITLSAAAASDVRGGIADSRVLGVLLVLAEDHTLDWVGPIRTGHSYYVRGTRRISNHSFGRAVDIISVDGARVSSTNLGALQAVRTLLSLPDPLRPDEVGSPWRVPSYGSFTDSSHQLHIHVGFSNK